MIDEESSGEEASIVIAILKIHGLIKNKFIPTASVTDSFNLGISESARADGIMTLGGGRGEPPGPRHFIIRRIPVEIIIDSENIVIVIRGIPYISGTTHSFIT
jgi:hypothetical protein